MICPQLVVPPTNESCIGERWWSFYSFLSMSFKKWITHKSSKHIETKKFPFNFFLFFCVRFNNILSICNMAAASQDFIKPQDGLEECNLSFKPFFNVMLLHFEWVWCWSILKTFFCQMAKKSRRKRFFAFFFKKQFFFKKTVQLSILT